MTFFDFGWARKSLAMVGLAAGLTIGGVSTANAGTWNFSYSGSGVTAAGTFTGAWNGTYFDVTSITGARNGDLITGLFGADNYYVTTLSPYLPSLRIQFNTASGAFTLGWVDWAGNSGLGADLGYPGGGIVGTDASHPTFSSTDTYDAIVPVGTLAYGLCDIGSSGCTSVGVHVEAVPEIKASAGLGALAVLLGFAFLLREMFLRRRYGATPF